METLKIGTGRINLQVVDELGNERGIFSFNPEDLNQAERFFSAQKKTELMNKEYAEAEKNAATDEDKLELLKKYVNEIKQMIDEIFGAGSSQTLFGDDCCLSMFFDFFDGITPYYTKASAERMKKYKDILKNKNKK